MVIVQTNGKITIKRSNNLFINLSGRRSQPAFSLLEMDDMKAITVLASTVSPAFKATQRFSIAVSRNFSNAVADAEAGRLLGSPLTRNEHLLIFANSNQFYAIQL